MRSRYDSDPNTNPNADPNHHDAWPDLAGWWRSRTAGRRWLAAAAGTAVAALCVSGVAVAGGMKNDAVKASQHSAAPSSASRPGTSHPRTGHAAIARTAAAGPRTSCRSVAHIGDSTSVDLISPASVPDPALRLGAQYSAVGVRHVRIDASGGRSVVEEMPGQVNGYDVARAWWSGGYRGCWVFALGTNDLADVAAGSHIGLWARIQQMMSAAHGEPVLWVNTATLLPSGPWAAANSRAWDKLLVKAASIYPNLRVYNWAADAQPGWFLPDGIHYTPAGCAHRAHDIAGALARAFPARGHPASHVIS
jgi:hypothetical protein